MKKVLYLIAIAIALGFTACSEDKCDHQTEISPEATNSVVGNWYNEAYNEECRYSADGTLYDKFNNVERSDEVEGRWEYDKANSKLSWRYVFMGQNQFIDWKVKNLNDYSMTISNNNGEFTYEKIVETYKLEVGNTANIKFAVEYPDYVVSSYVSSNPRLATVNSDGVIKAEGEKGTAYIKIQTNQGNVWVKVVVGDDCQDLWYDYVDVISQDYSTMISTFSSLGKPNTGDDDFFRFMHKNHDVVDITKVHLCPEDGLVDEIQLVLKKSVPEAEVLAYMNAHYYGMEENESLVYYSTLKDKDASKAIVGYDKEKKVVSFKETKHFFQTAHIVNKFGLYYQCLGLTRDQIVNKYGNPFSDEDGMMYYDVYTDYINLAAFRIDSTTKKCSIVLTTINEAISTDVVLNSFNEKYVVFEKGTPADGSQYAWINGATLEESTLGIIYIPNDKMIIYQPLNGTANAKVNSMSRTMNNQYMKRIAHIK